MSHFAEGTDSGESPAVSSPSLQGCFLFFRTRPLSGFCYSPVGNGEGGPPSLLSRLERERRRGGWRKPLLSSLRFYFFHHPISEKTDTRKKGGKRGRGGRASAASAWKTSWYLFPPLSFFAYLPRKAKEKITNFNRCRCMSVLLLLRQNYRLFFVSVRIRKAFPLRLVNSSKVLSSLLSSPIHPRLPQLPTAAPSSVLVLYSSIILSLSLSGLRRGRRRLSAPRPPLFCMYKRRSFPP